MSALTKMFIVLQLVFSLVCAVLLVLMVSKTENYKALVDDYRVKNVSLGVVNTAEKAAKDAALAQQSTAQNQAKDAQGRLIEAQAAAASERAKLEQQLAETRAKNEQNDIAIAKLTNTNNLNAEIIKAYTTQLDTLRPQVTKLTKENAAITQALNEANNQLTRAESDIKKYQEMLAKGGGTAGAIAPTGSESQIQTISQASTGKVNSKISNLTLTQGRTLIEMPLGTRDGIAVGTKLYVYRASGYVGDATVQRVSPEESVAVIDSTKPGETARVGDLVSTVK